MNICIIVAGNAWVVVMMYIATFYACIRVPQEKERFVQQKPDLCRQALCFEKPGMWFVWCIMFLQNWWIWTSYLHNWLTCLHYLNTNKHFSYKELFSFQRFFILSWVSQCLHTSVFQLFLPTIILSFVVQSLARNYNVNVCKIKQFTRQAS